MGKIEEGKQGGGPRDETVGKKIINIYEQDWGIIEK